MIMPHQISKTFTCLRLSSQLFRAASQVRSHIGLVQQSRGMRQYREKTYRSMYWRARSFDAVKYPMRKRSEFLDWNYRAEIFALSRRIQENLSEDTLRQVFAHPSYLDELKLREAKLDLPSTKLESNSDLVEIGHQLLDKCIKPYLRYTFDRVPEEGIVAITKYLVSEPVLADVAKWIGCKEVILSSEYPPSPLTMMNTVKALIAGIERELGFDRVQRFCVDMIISYLNDKDILEDVWVINNPKELLSHILRNSQLPPYEPRIMFQTGYKTIESCHVVGLYTNQKLLGSSAGETIQIAEECAALNSLQKMFDLTDNRAPFVYGDESEKIDYANHQKEHIRIESYTCSL